MKSNFLALLLFCGSAAFSQTIKLSETDTASNVRHIETGPKWVNKGLGNGFAFGLRSADSVVFVQLSIFPTYNGLIAGTNPLVFTLENDSLVVAQSSRMQLRSNNYKVPYEYSISLQDLKMLSRLATKSVSFYGAGGSYRDNKIASPNQWDIQQVCLAFLREFEKKDSTKNNTVNASTRQ